MSMYYVALLLCFQTFVANSESNETIPNLTLKYLPQEFAQLSSYPSKDFLSVIGNVSPTLKKATELVENSDFTAAFIHCCKRNKKLVEAVPQFGLIRDSVNKPLAAFFEIGAFRNVYNICFDQKYMNESETHPVNVAFKENMNSVRNMIEAANIGYFLDENVVIRKDLINNFAAFPQEVRQDALIVSAYAKKLENYVSSLKHKSKEFTDVVHQLLYGIVNTILSVSISGDVDLNDRGALLESLKVLLMRDTITWESVFSYIGMTKK